MTAPAASQLRLELVPHGWKDRLLPEQSAEFDLILRNTGSAPVNALPLSGSYDTPRLALFDADGKVIGGYNKGHRYERRGGDLALLEPPEPRLEPMPPGQGDEITVNLWAFRAPLPPGRYSIQAQHQFNLAGTFASSERLPFEIVPARIGPAASGYDSVGRSASTLAWLASESAHPGPQQLLIRVSAVAGHRALMQGATPHGEFPPGSTMAIAQPAEGIEENGAGWVAVISGGSATLIHHNLSYPFWRSEAIPLHLENAAPVPRFPDFEDQALFLATGTSPKGPALGGIQVEDEKGVIAQWTVPLSGIPSMVACSARVKRPVSLLLITNHEGGSRIAWLAVNMDGRVVTAEKTIRQSPNHVVAVAPSADPRSGNAFFILESAPSAPDRLAVLSVSTGGSVRTAELKLISNWPKNAAGSPVRPREICLEEIRQGVAGIAFTDESHALYGGRLTPNPMLAKLRDDPKSPCFFPHIAALNAGLTVACFTGEGLLFFAGAEESH